MWGGKFLRLEIEGWQSRVRDFLATFCCWTFPASFQAQRDEICWCVRPLPARGANLLRKGNESVARGQHIYRQAQTYTHTWAPSLSLAFAASTVCSKVRRREDSSDLPGVSTARTNITTRSRRRMGYTKTGHSYWNGNPRSGQTTRL